MFNKLIQHLDLFISSLYTQRWGHIDSPLSAQSVSVCARILFISLQRFLSYRWSNTRRWPNAGLMLAHRLRRWANIRTVFGHFVMFGATLDVGQHRRRRANSNSALVQSILPVPPTWSTHCRAELILPSTGDAELTFNRHLVSELELKPSKRGKNDEAMQHMYWMIT